MYTVSYFHLVQPKENLSFTRYFSPMDLTFCWATMLAGLADSLSLCPDFLYNIVHLILGRVSLELAGNDSSYSRYFLVGRAATMARELWHLAGHWPPHLYSSYTVQYIVVFCWHCCVYTIHCVDLPTSSGSGVSRPRHLLWALHVYCRTVFQIWACLYALSCDNATTRPCDTL